MKSTINFGYLIFLSVVAALGGFLFGYDTAVISGTIAQVTQLFQLDTLQQGWYVGCALVGSIVGVLFAGILSDKLGRKLTMVISAVLFSTSALGCALSADFTQLVIYRIIGGVGIGVVSIVSPLYISEVAVAQYRGRLVSLYQLAVTVGFLGAYLVNYQLLAWAESGTQLSVDWLNKVFITEVWRGMLGMETLPAILFFIIMRSPVQSRVPLLRKALKLRPLGGFHSWRSFLLKRDGNTTGTQNDINVHKKGTHYI